MIKIIGSDLDGTLLDKEHKLADETLYALHNACDAGIRLIVVTARDYPGVMSVFKNTDIVCDYILGSGSEVRNDKKEIISTCLLDLKTCQKVYETVKKQPVDFIFCSDKYDYTIVPDLPDGESCPELSIYHQTSPRTKYVPNFSFLEINSVPVYKIVILSENDVLLTALSSELKTISNIAVASSFKTNLEITAQGAQKGPVLKNYIESLGYTMDEVMVFGDSENDLSMLSLDFGITVAMGNGTLQAKSAAKYITKPNTEHGVAYAIQKLLSYQQK